VPLIPVHHVRGHIAANYITHPELEPPFVCLCVSGGNTMLVDVRDYTDMAILGATRDDAAGECFDKVARVLGIGYPGGAPMDALAQGGDDRRYELPRAHVADAPLDMSFSGLKTAVLNLAHNAAHKAYRCRQQQRHSAAGKVPAALFAGRLLVCGGRCRVRLCRACRAVVPIIVCSVGGIGPTAAHIGIPGIRVFLPGGIIIFPLILVFHNEYVLSEKRGYGLQNGPDDSMVLFYRKIVKNPSPSQ